MLINSVKCSLGGGETLTSLARFKRTVFGHHSRRGSIAGGSMKDCLKISAESDFRKGV